MAERCPTPQEGCRYAGTPECIKTVHHHYFPAPDYQDEVGAVFRELPENKTWGVPRCEHDRLHDEIEPPTKPPLEFMVDAIRNSSRYQSRKVKRLVRNYE